jgi:hypothetical protein
VAPLVSRDELGTQVFTLGFWAKDYSSPIADEGGATIGDVGWTGHCAIVLAPDPTTGTTVVALGGPASNGDSFAAVAVGNPFSHCLVTSYSMVGTLPPGVSFDSSTGALSGTCSADCTWGITVTVTGAAPAATGEVLGAPLPAGYQNYWDFNYDDWLGCCYHAVDDPSHITWSWYQVGWGMDVGTFNTNAGCQLPLNATQWSNYFQSVNKPQGAFIFYNDPGNAYYGDGCNSSDDTPSGALDAGALFAGKYAEILEIWPSQNFARPAGDDKFLIDENQTFCAVNSSGSVWVLTDPVTGLAPPDGTDFSGYWGGAATNGFFDVTVYSSGTLTLGTKVYDVPSNWVSKSNADDALCFGKLRFPTCPALLGRAGVTVDMSGSTFTFDTPQPAFGMTTATHQEQIDIYNTAMTVLDSNVTATRMDDSTFTTTGSYATARYVTIHGAPAWYMNDIRPKGDYAFLEWLSDFRSFGEYTRLTGVLDCSGAQVDRPTANAGGGPIDASTMFASFSGTQSCVPFGRCNPRVVCVSPNGESFPNGVTHAFPADFVCDQQYGSKWWGFVQSTMTDLYWQQPHRPCNIEPCSKWTMDGGLCADDQPRNPPAFCCPGDDDYVPDESQPPVYYYGHAPQWKPV